MAYDSRAVKVPKAVKTVAANIEDKALRRSFIREFVTIAEQEAHNRNIRNRSLAASGSNNDE